MNRKVLVSIMASLALTFSVSINPVSGQPSTGGTVKPGKTNNGSAGSNGQQRYCY